VAERCERTDLLVTDCAHCRGLPDLPTGPEPTLRPDGGGAVTIAARYGGYCHECGRSIRIGDSITSVDDGWVGECCVEVSRDRVV
jgi:hypothetical protein